MLEPLNIRCPSLLPFVEIMEQFGGTMEDLYFHVAELQGINVDTFNRLKKYARNL